MMSAWTRPGQVCPSTKATATARADRRIRVSFRVGTPRFVCKSVSPSDDRQRVRDWPEPRGCTTGLSLRAHLEYDTEDGSSHHPPRLAPNSGLSRDSRLRAVSLTARIP